MIDDRTWLQIRCGVPGREAPKEEAFCRAVVAVPQAVALLGGAGGGGKSHALRTLAFWILACLRDWGHPQQTVMLACSNYPLLRDRHVSKLVSEFAGIGEYRQSDKVHGQAFVFNDKSLGRIALRNLDEPGKYRGTECAAALVDELTELPEEIAGEPTLSTLRYPIRSPERLPILPFAAASNPDGVGWRWVKELWIEKHIEKYKLRPEQIIFTQSLVTDNPYAGPEMIATLDSLTGHLYRARRWGDWDAPLGARWPDLDENVHRFTMRKQWPHGVPAGWRKLYGHDWGKRAPYCGLWAVVDPDGDIWIYREHYEAQVDTDAQARNVRTETGENEYIDALRFDPSMWAATQSLRVDEPGPPLISFFEDELAGDERFGSLEKGFNRNRATALATYDLLLTRGNGYPDLYIERGCEQLWGELKGATWDTRGGLSGKREDIDPRNPDHAITAGYYMLHAEIEPYEPKRLNDDVIDGEAAIAAWRQERHEHTLEAFEKRHQAGSGRFF